MGEVKTEEVYLAAHYGLILTMIKYRYIHLSGNIKHNFHFIFLLTVSVPHNFWLVFLHSWINNDSAAQTHCLALSAKSHFKFVNDGGLKGDTMLRTETICRHGRKIQN